MKKKLLYLYNELKNDEIFIAKKSDLFIQIGSNLPSIEKDFVLRETHEKLFFLEKIVLFLKEKLDCRITPNPPKNLYLPENELYLKLEIFGKPYKLLQGDEKDGEILILLKFLELIKFSICNSLVIFGKYIYRKGDVYQTE